MTLFHMIIFCKQQQQHQQHQNPQKTHNHRNKGSEIQYILMGNILQPTTLPSQLLTDYFPK